MTVGGSSAAAAAANAAAVANNGGLGLMKLADGDCTALTTYHQHRPVGQGGHGGGDTTLINRAFQDNGFEAHARRRNDNGGGGARSPDVIPRGYGMMANEQHTGTHYRDGQKSVS